MSEESIEYELWLDRLIYGESYYELINGKTKRRVNPQDVIRHEDGSYEIIKE